VLLTSNRSLTVTRPGASEVLELRDRPLDAPGRRELLVRIAASGVNFIEIYQREGSYPVPLPFALGAEAAGWIEAVGADVLGFDVGQAVAWADVDGSHSDYVLVPVDRAVPVPDGLDPLTAAAAMLQGMTAHYLVSSAYPVQPGDSVLVHAAAGGVGQLLVQLAKARGAYVVGTASTPDKIEKARALGADHVVNYTDHPDPDDLRAALRRANPGAGYSVAYDGVGRSTFMASLTSLAPRATMVLFGAASGPVDPVDPQLLNRHGSLFLTRPRLAHYVATREELLWRGHDVLTAIADGALRIEIGGRYPLSDAARAYDDLQARRTTGKLLLTR
jgi:NADPH:quinone reductase